MKVFHPIRFMIIFFVVLMLSAGISPAQTLPDNPRLRALTEFIEGLERGGRPPGGLRFWRDRFSDNGEEIQIQMQIAFYQDADFSGADFRFFDLGVVDRDTLAEQEARLGTPPLFFSFSSSNFTRADLRSSRFHFTDFHDTECVNTHFGQASLLGSNFLRANLSRADFSGAHLEWVTFEGANLRNAVFRGAFLHNTNFRNADLRRANFRHPNGINTSMVNFEGADLRGADLRDFLFHWNGIAPLLSGARFDRTTILPGYQGVIQSDQEWEELRRSLEEGMGMEFVEPSGEALEEA